MHLFYIHSSYLPDQNVFNAGDVNILEFLAKKGADVNASANDGWTPLHIAAHLGREQHVESLLKLGAHVNATNSVGQTPLYLATRSKISVK